MRVPEPIAAKVKALNSLLSDGAKPANSTRTYCSVPELSVGDGAAGVRHLVVLAADDLRAVGARAFDDDVAAAVARRVADDDQAAPIARLALADRTRRREHDRQSAVPRASIFAPRMMNSDEPSVLKSPWIFVPG